MEGSSEQKGQEKPRPKEKIKINFIEMPDGVIKFSAPQKRFPKLKKGPWKIRARHLSHKNEDVDGISKMMQKMSFPIEKGKPKSAPTQRAVKTALRKFNFTQKKDPINITTAKKHIFSKEKLSAFKPKFYFKDHEPCIFIDHRGFWRRAYSPSLIMEALQTTSSLTPQRYQNLSMMSTYGSKSAEEIRFEDYLSGRKGMVSTDHCGPKFQSVRGTDSVRRTHAFTNILTDHQVITASREYSAYSLEELRLEHYMPSIAWKDRNRHSLTLAELKKLPVGIGSAAFVYMDGVKSKRKGVIRYIGHLPKKPADNIFAGMEFDDQCGICDGCYEGVKLFRTKYMCAEFIPIDSVLPEYLLTEKKVEKNNCSTSDPLSTSSADDDKEPGSRCSVCWDKPIEIIFLPCGHLCSCKGCSKELKDCPVCRKKITKVHRAYIAGK